MNRRHSAWRHGAWTTPCAAVLVACCVGCSQPTSDVAPAPRQTFDDIGTMDETPVSLVDATRHDRFVGIVTGTVVKTRGSVKSSDYPSMTTDAVIKIEKTTGGKGLKKGSTIVVFFHGGTTTLGAFHRYSIDTADGEPEYPSRFDRTPVDLALNGAVPPAKGDHVLLFLGRDELDKSQWAPIGYNRGAFIYDAGAAEGRGPGDGDAPYSLRGEAPGMPRTITINELHDALAEASGPEAETLSLG